MSRRRRGASGGWWGVVWEATGGEDPFYEARHRLALLDRQGRVGRRGASYTHAWYGALAVGGAGGRRRLRRE